MRSILTNTTALVACLTLSLPAPVIGQETKSEEPELCEDGSAPPCGEAAAEAAAGSDAEADAEAEAGADAEATAAEAAEGEVEDGPAPEEAVEAETPVESEADIAVEPEAAEDGETAAEAAEGEVEDGPAPEEAVEAETPVESEADIAVEPEAVEPGQAEDDGAAKADASPASDSPASEETTEVEAPAETEADATADTKAAADKEAAPDAEATSQSAAPKADADDGARARAEKQEAGDKAAASDDGTRKAERRERRKSAKEAAKAEAAAAEQAGKAAKSAAAASAGADAEAEVTEETVTEESARSSDENFASRISDVFDGSGDNDNRDLLVGTVLGGLGGFAVSQILNDRQVVASSEDRVVVQRADGEYQLLKDDNALLRQPGSQVRTQTFNDGSTRSVVTRPDGTQIVTIRDAELRVVQRTRITPDGQEIVLIDDLGGTQAIDVSALPQAPAAAAEAEATANEEALRRALDAAQRPERSYSLAQVREVQAVRTLAPAIELDNITFETGSAAITPGQAEELNELGQLIAGMVADNPREIFLVEGHTDAVGEAAMNLALSDRRAESVALALTEYFDVPPENLVVQGYGERYLRVDTEVAERLNRRASVRRITDLLQVASAD